MPWKCSFSKQTIQMAFFCKFNLYALASHNINSKNRIQRFFHRQPEQIFACKMFFCLYYLLYFEPDLLFHRKHKAFNQILAHKQHNSSYKFYFCHNRHHDSGYLPGHSSYMALRCNFDYHLLHLPRHTLPTTRLTDLPDEPKQFPKMA